MLGCSSAKKCRSSLLHDGCSLDQFDLDHVVGSVEPCSGMSPNTGVSGQVASSFVTDAVLAFIKAYRLRGDSVSLKTITLERFVPLSIEQAKLCLWSSCIQWLRNMALLFNARKSQLIRFTFTMPTLDSSRVNLTFCGESLPYSDKVTHLGHILQSDL